MANPIRVVSTKETARRLREAMDDRNMRAVDIVNLTGVSKASVSHYLKGIHAPSSKAAGEIARVLKVSPVWLMGFDVTKYDPIIQQGYDRADFISKYDSLSDENKKMVAKMVDALISSQAD